jgi:hypothetical protein
MFIWFHILHVGAVGWSTALKMRKVTGSIGINPSGRNLGPGSTEPLQ